MTRSVLIIGNFLSHANGSRGVCEDLADRLQEIGWRVLTASRHKRRVARLADMLVTTWNKRRCYSTAQIDVYSGAAFSYAEAVAWVLRRAGKPYVLTLHGGNLPGFAERYPLRVRRLLQSAACVTAPSRYLAEQMNEYASDIRVLPNPIDVKSYPFALRRSPRPRLMWLRAFHEIYHPAMAIDVVRDLHETTPDVQLTMVGPDKGDGSYPRTREAVLRAGLEAQCHFVGPVSKADVPRWLAQGDIFLNTTSIDNTPVTVLEAMACGLCVVSTNVGGMPYLVKHEHDALLVPPDNPSAMAAAVRRLLEEPNLAERLSRNGREKAEDHDWSRVLPAWESLLNEFSEARFEHVG